MLELLKSVLPKTTNDIELASKILNAMEKELFRKNQVSAFEKFCERVELPSMEATSIVEVKKQLADAFGEDAVKVTADKKVEALNVELKTPEGTLTAQIKVGQKSEEGEDPEFVPKFVPFPVALPTDPELVWMLAKRENLTPEEAGMTLAKVEEDFWASKSGQKLLRDRVERTFAEFVSRVPSKLLSEGGLKRHYKEPEAVKQFKTLNK